MLDVPVRLHDVVEAMIRAELITEDDALDQAKVAKVVGEVMCEWARRWK